MMIRVNENEKKKWKIRVKTKNKKLLSNRLAIFSRSDDDADDDDNSALFHPKTYLPCPKDKSPLQWFLN